MAYGSLNELEDDEKGAVQNMKPRQLSYFSKLMEQRDITIARFGHVAGWV